MPPFIIPLLEAMAPMLKKRDTYYVVAIVVLALLLGRARAALRLDAALLAARPAVTDATKTASDFHEERGKVTVVERFLPAPAASAACPDPKPQLAERDTIREPSVIDRRSESEHAHTEAPACPAAAPAPWRYAGVLADPTAPSKLVGVHGGVTLGNRLDLGVGVRFAPRTEYHGEVGIRF